MSTSLESAVQAYLRDRSLSRGTRKEYALTLRKWKQWGPAIPIEDLSRKDIREFLDRVQEEAIAEQGTNPGRTANKARENLRAFMSCAWEQDLLETLPRFPPAKDQRDVAGRHYLTKAELNALYFATYQLPILWRYISWDQCSPDGRQKDRSRWGWIFFHRVKTQKSFYRPMNRVVHEHIPESSVEILGHAVGGITYRHYAHRDPLAFRAIMTIPQPSAFLALVKGHDGECRCCRRPFQTAD